MVAKTEQRPVSFIGPAPHIMIVEARFYEDITDELVERSLRGAMYEAGPGQGKAHLTTFFAAANARGVLAIPDPELAAEQFGAMILGHMKMRMELGIELPSEERIERGLRSGVDAFLRAYAAPTP